MESAMGVVKIGRLWVVGCAVEKCNRQGVTSVGKSEAVRLGRRGGFRVVKGLWLCGEHVSLWEERWGKGLGA